LGWSPPEGKELLSLVELFDLFEISRINKAGAVFDTVKLTWMNKQYLAQLDNNAFLQVVRPFISSVNQQLESLDEKVISVRDNLETLARVNHYLEVYTLTTEAFYQKFLTLQIKDFERDVLQEAQAFLSKSDTWSVDKVRELIEVIMTSLSLGRGKVMKPLRKGFTGYESGPNLVDCLSLIPRQEILKRLDKVL
jgi:glutamyl/glutaminyl-tRNA synthetase